MSMRENLIITRAAELEALSVFRDFIARVCLRLGIPQPVIFELQLACDEAATNIIQHGYAGMNPGSIMLEVQPRPGCLALELSDFGHPFEPVETDAPDVNSLLADEPTTGFGLFFIYQSMDDVQYYTDEQGNHLVLVKNLPIPNVQ
jgi:serine/threonine-protein kinase RsbW